jgi:hypothetical protein
VSVTETTGQLLEELKRRGSQWRLRDPDFGKALEDYSRQLRCTLPLKLLDYRGEELAADDPDGLQRLKEGACLTHRL